MTVGGICQKNLSSLHVQDCCQYIGTCNALYWCHLLRARKICPQE